MHPKSLLTTRNIEKQTIEELITCAEKIRKNSNEYEKCLKNKIVYHLFLEPSTRTSSSFMAATYKLGGNAILVNNPNYSSMVKGESFEDMVKTIEYYSDIIVTRTPHKGMAFNAASLVNIPVINAGDGDGEHPTQSLLDIYTIYKEKGKLENINMGFVGDLRYSRTIHSLCHFAKLYSMNVFCISPKEISLPKEYENLCNVISKEDNIKKVISELDVIYVTRIQKERHPELSPAFDTSMYRITPELMKNAKNDCIVMHPLPRNDEIHPSFDNDSRAAYFRQVENGLWIRCAILKNCIE